MQKKLTPLEKYNPLWIGWKSVYKYDAKVGYQIRFYCLKELYNLRKTNLELFNKKDFEELIKMMEELKQEKINISSLAQNCTLEEYQKFLEDYFKKIDDEDRHGIFIFKTAAKFRIMASFIDVLQSWEDLDEEMKKCKKYCLYKAVTIYKALKKGKIPQWKYRSNRRFRSWKRN